MKNWYFKHKFNLTSSPTCEEIILFVSYSLSNDVVDIIIKYLNFEYFHSCNVIKRKPLKC